MQEVQLFPRRRWVRVVLCVILALITFALMFLIILPALLAPKQ